MCVNKYEQYPTYHEIINVKTTSLKYINFVNFTFQSNAIILLIQFILHTNQNLFAVT